MITILIVTTYKIIEKMIYNISNFYWNMYLNSYLDYKKVIHGKCRFYGRTLLNIHSSASCEIGFGFICRSGKNSCIYGDSKISVGEKSILKIGNNSGFSYINLYVREKVIIGDNVNVGAGTIIMDSNFHSIDFRIRIDRAEDQKKVATAPIIIENNVFIGARSIISKGVVIGENSIVAVGSVVVKSIPRNQIWGGNPAVYIKNIEE